MAIFELFSKKLKKSKGEMPDVYAYEEIPQQLKVQIIHILEDTYGDDTSYNSTWSADAFQFIHKTLCKEYGVFTLKEYAQTDKEAVLHYF